jgi:hypothetical protein
MQREKNAGVIVWVAQELRDEYRQAWTWLNDHTDSKTEFFGIELDAFRIDSSLPVCDFKVVVAPNGYQKRSAEETLLATSGRYEKYRDFFQLLIDELRTTHRFTNSRTAPPQNWMTFGSGSSGLAYGLSFAQGSRVRAELYIDIWDAAVNKSVFDMFERQKSELEGAFGETLSWERLEDRRASRIALYRHGTIDDSPEELMRIREWGVNNLLRFRRVFGPLLEEAKKNAIASEAREAD